ncbi:hypothetical protein B0A55_06107 [Friedmanniomyces simplex]|uniref:Survival protein SurE-like phosphatase/nucleotidase domain-containing protein n=1 Tax=Friedmanniomyces simplex TaxID=329884 RepID=A0A4V5NJ45_9PEZI|nr:hypothetical protein B0A55_06107 [Friedmanniomyces simplex]
MHILVTNDDGPPSTAASPYLLPFVRALERAGHRVSVIIPDSQRSWIGKAHLVGQDVRATAYWPPGETPDVHSVDEQTNGGNGGGEGGDDRQPWILVNSTPASCAQLGLSKYFFQSSDSSTPKIDLVISGPNYGRNTTAVFALSSGTLGAALEAAVCGARAIALSFAFFDRVTGGEIVDEACELSVKVCEYLANANGKGKGGSEEGEGRVEWGDGRLYSVNVPLRKGVSGKPVRWTSMLQNQWEQGACFQELTSDTSVDGAEAEEVRLRRQESGEGGAEAGSGTATPAQQRWKPRHFKWAPRFTDVYESVQRAGPGSDGWAVKEGETSITAIRANFMHAGPGEGEVKL